MSAENWHEERDRLVLLIEGIESGKVTHIDEADLRQLQATKSREHRVAEGPTCEVEPSSWRPQFLRPPEPIRLANRLGVMFRKLPIEFFNSEPFRRALGEAPRASP